MRPAHSKSQLQPPRQKTSEVTTQTQQAKRRKSQLADNPSREDCAKGPTRRRGEGKDLIQAKNQQLFGIIETFYSTLCSLPMEMLINSADPQFWLSEQQATLKELFRKLQGMSRDKDYDYYNWKLESVSKLL